MSGGKFSWGPLDAGLVHHVIMRLMKVVPGIPCVLLTLLLLAPVTGVADLVYREGEGWIIEGEPESADSARAAGQLEEARAAERAGDLGRALGAYRDVVREHPETEQARIAQFKVGELYEKGGDFSRAFEAYQKLIDDYPGTEMYNEAVGAQFRIATLFLEGERQRVLGLPTLPSMRKAQEMFEAVIENGPFTEFAPLAQFNIGLAHQKQNETAEAIAAFQTVIDRYPNSDLADDAQYQIAYVWFEEARRGSYDQTVVQKAREAFQDFLLRYPESEKVEQAEENLALLEDRKTESAIDIARFYDKAGHFKAAVIYYNVVLEQEPDSEAGEEARRRIDEISSQVGEDALVVGVERAETGRMARSRERMQAEVDTAARSDYVGPPAPVIPDELPPERPRLRTSPMDVEPLPPAIEPDLPSE